MNRSYATPRRSARTKRYAALALAGAAIVLSAGTSSAQSRVVVSNFATPGLAGWESRSFKGETRYRVIRDGEQSRLAARCDATASAIARRVSVDLNKTPMLHWQWRLIEGHAGHNERTKAGDDFAARVYVIRDGGMLKWRTRAINYVWTNSTGPGTHWPNPFTDKAMMVTVEAGAPAGTPRWVSESRNVRADFKRFHDLDLARIDAVAIMTDCDNTGGRAAAEYRGLYFAPE